MKNLCLTTALFALFASPLFAQLPSGWRAHDLKRPSPPVVDPGDAKLPSSIPSDAIVLFDGSNLDQWTSRGGEATWKIVDGAVESVAGGGYLVTKQKFGDCQLHLEWASPATPKGDGQGRGNSGVYLMGKYEVQVLDSFNNRTYSDGSAGAIYGQYPPLVNVSRGPGQWQSYDIIFRRPRFDAGGELLSPARITVLHNGVLIQDNEELYGPTNWIKHNNYQQHADELSLKLQDHGNPVRFRNIWIRTLPSERDRPDEPYENPADIVELSETAKTKLLGNYGRHKVEDRGGKLYFLHHGLPLEMIPLSDTRFAFRKSAGHAEFTLDDTGQIKSVNLQLDAAGSRSIPKADD